MTVLATAVLGAVPAPGGGWDDRFTLPGIEGVVLALASDGVNLYAGGRFDIASGTSGLGNVARWDGTTWTPLGRGVDGWVYALAWDGSNLYAGGVFQTAGSWSARNVARWDGTDWAPLDDGIDGGVHALLWSGSTLYAGGTNIWSWDGTRWSIVGGSGVCCSGPAGSTFVTALESDGSSLYVTGRFDHAGAIAANSIARWDGSSWFALDDGFDLLYGRALAWDGSSLYVGGSFAVGGRNVARWDGASWSELGAGVDGDVLALEWDGAGLVVGGSFPNAGGSPAGAIARWDGASWSTFGEGMDGSAMVRALAWDGSELHAGGTFGTADGVAAASVASWDGAAWRAHPAGGAGIAHPVSALAWSGSSLYVGGEFAAAGEVEASRVARWDGARWHALGAGTDGSTAALEWNGTSLFAGGEFVTAGGATVNHVARWDGSTWSPLGAGMDGPVAALEWDGTGLVAGGSFTTAGGTPVYNVARWDGTSWSPLGTGLDGRVDAIAWDGTALVAGGAFTMAGGTTVNRIARWDGSTWSPLGTGMNGDVHALLWNGASLFAAGEFETAGGVLAWHIARWDGAGWSALGGSYIQGDIKALAWDGSNLYAGGHSYPDWYDFIERWDGTRWTALGRGLDSDVRALAWDGSGIYAGGLFTTARGTPSARIARWSDPAITISPGSLPPADVSSSYSVTFSAAGGTPPYTFAPYPCCAQLPPGLSLDPAGVLSGLPSQPGAFEFGVRATDLDGETGDVDLVLLVNRGCPIAVTPSSLPDATAGVAYSQLFTASGGTPPHAFSVAAGSLPAGVALSTTGTLSGTPTESGVFSFVADVRDASGCIGMASYALVVATGGGNIAAGQGFGPPNVNRVRLFLGDGRPSATDFVAYGAGWGVAVAAGATGSDPRGVDVLATGPGPGPALGPHVRAFVREGTPVAKVSFYAYGSLRHGVNPGAGALDGDGLDELLTGAGAGAVFGPHVRGWNVDGGVTSAISKVNFFAYATLRWGVNVASGDVDGDGFGELLTGPGPGVIFGPQVRGFDYDATSVSSLAKINFAAFATSGHGVDLDAGPVDADAFDEIAAATGPGPSFTPDVAGFGYDATSVTPLPGFARTISTASRYGARVGLGDVDGDAVAELLAGKGRDPGADAIVARYVYTGSTLVPLTTLDAFPGSAYGVDVQGAATGY